MSYEISAFAQALDNSSKDIVMSNGVLVASTEPTKQGEVMKRIEKVSSNGKVLNQRNIYQLGDHYVIEVECNEQDKSGRTASIVFYFELKNEKFLYLIHEQVIDFTLSIGRTVNEDNLNEIEDVLAETLKKKYLLNIILHCWSFIVRIIKKAFAVIKSFYLKCKDYILNE
ncbi:hypothetical protein [Pseudoalteromonas rhizosphaerae]|uniref:hypothetical protein n=1 Tax=Pseudoalteromonas rhizosphaerae TaxID=2518973 RepID=UPI001230B313|nr:hypothetical protein [Pseudoalteromonas rhizosphaerae]